MRCALEPTNERKFPVTETWISDAELDEFSIHVDGYLDIELGKPDDESVNIFTINIRKPKNKRSTMKISYERGAVR